MKISFVIPTYNRAHCIATNVESILTQRYREVEAIVVDDGSTDDPAAALSQFSGDSRLRIIRQPNQGQNRARNVGIAAAIGEIVTILDSDDHDSGGDLDQVVDAFLRDPGLGGVFTGAVAVSDGRIMGRMEATGRVFSAEGFVDGTYSGEYQFFLRRSELVQPIFEEGLGIKRSCTMLTWLKLGRTMRFVILPIVTRVYDDQGLDRMGSIDNIIKDSREILVCNQLILQKHGEQIRRISPKAYYGYHLTQAYYELLTYGRRGAIRTYLRVNPLLSPIKRWFLVTGSMVAGARLTRQARRLRGT